MARKSTVIRIYDESTGELLQKSCSKCGLIKDVSEFNKHPKHPDGLMSSCKSCNNKRLKEYKKTDKWKKYKKEHYEANKEPRLEKMKERYKNNREYIKNRSKEYYENNKERYKERYEAKILQALEDIRLIVEANPTKYDYIPGMDIYGIIYLVYNRITKKYYVGQSTRSFDLRYECGFFHNHIENDRPNQLLQQDLELYGEDSFEFNKLFKVASNQYELDKIEAYWIDKLEAYTKGYNRNRGMIFTNRGIGD